MFCIKHPIVKKLKKRNKPNGIEIANFLFYNTIEIRFCIKFSTTFDKYVNCSMSWQVNYLYQKTCFSVNILEFQALILSRWHL